MEENGLVGECNKTAWILRAVSYSLNSAGGELESCNMCLGVNTGKLLIHFSSLCVSF